jgi:hypothetical protein
MGRFNTDLGDIVQVILSMILILQLKKLSCFVKTKYTDRMEGSQDLTYGMYRAFDELEQMVILLLLIVSLTLERK